MAPRRASASGVKDLAPNERRSHRVPAEKNREVPTLGADETVVLLTLHYAEQYLGIKEYEPGRENVIGYRLLEWLASSEPVLRTRSLGAYG
jgi:hypothetical protein